MPAINIKKELYDKMILNGDDVTKTVNLYVEQGVEKRTPRAMSFLEQFIIDTKGENITQEYRDLIVYIDSLERNYLNETEKYRTEHEKSTRCAWKIYLDLTENQRKTLQLEVVDKEKQFNNEVDDAIKKYEVWKMNKIQDIPVSARALPGA